MGSDYELFLELLEKTGKKTSDVAKATGIRASVFSDWKSGRYTPKMDKLKRIAEYFGIPVDYFTGEQEYYEAVRASTSDFSLTRVKHIRDIRNALQGREEDVLEGNY